MALYKGFSTINSKSQKKFVLTDHDLIKQDLLNAFNIHLGSVPMQPTVGCIIWQMLFENLTQAQLDDISANVTSIVNSDPRINLQGLDISTQDNTLTITLTLLYVATNQVETMRVNFNSANQTAVYY